MPNTSLSALPYPLLTDSNNPPADLQALATALDAKVTPQIASYTPVWSQANGTVLAVGNGTLAGQYIKIGRFVHFRLTLTRGSTTNIGSDYYFWTLPFGANTFLQSPGTGTVTVGGVVKGVTLRMANTTTVAAIRNSDDSNLGHTSFSWAAGDTIVLTGSYQAGS